MKDSAPHTANSGKFTDPRRTARGEIRATVPLSDPQTLWFNTGTLCNITCVNCYIDSSPTNDALEYITLDEMIPYLNEAEERGWGLREIAFTGGEPFMNPQMVDMARHCLERGYEVLILTNAMLPMMRPRVREGLLDIRKAYGEKLTLRISLDLWSQEHHDDMARQGQFQPHNYGYALAAG